MVEEQLSSGGERYAYRLVDACPVCVSHCRAEVDEQLVDGLSPSEVAAQWSYSAGPSAAELREHVARRHLPVARAVPAGGGAFDTAAVRAGRDAAPAAGQDVADLARTVIRAAVQRIQAGEVQPTTRDGLAAASLLLRLDGAIDPAGGVDTDTMQRVMGAYMDALRPLLTSDQMQQFGRTLDANPLIQQLWEEDRRQRNL